VKSDALANYDPGVYADAAIAALKHSGADSLLALTSAQGKDLLPRIAAKLKLPLIMDASVVNVAESSVVKSHFSGRANAEISLSGDLKLFGVRPNSVDPEAKAASATVESIDADLSSDSRMVLKEVVENLKSDKVELTSGSTCHAAGLVTQFHTSPSIMAMRIYSYSVELEMESFGDSIALEVVKGPLYDPKGEKAWA